jgi:hypothetical protein
MMGSSFPSNRTLWKSIDSIFEGYNGFTAVTRTFSFTLPEQIRGHSVVTDPDTQISTDPVQDMRPVSRTGSEK